MYVSLFCLRALATTHFGRVPSTATMSYVVNVSPIGSEQFVPYSDEYSHDHPNDPRLGYNMEASGSHYWHDGNVTPWNKRRSGGVYFLHTREMMKVRYHPTFLGLWMPWTRERVESNDHWHQPLPTGMWHRLSDQTPLYRSLQSGGPDCI